MQREERARVRKKLITELKFLEGSGKGDGNQKLFIGGVGKVCRTTDYSLYKI